MKKRPAFTLLEMVVSVAVFMIAVSIALYATVGTNGLIYKTDTRTVLADGARAVSDQLQRLIGNSSVGSVSVFAVPGSTSDNIVVQVKTFSGDSKTKICEVIGLASSFTKSGSQVYYLDPVTPTTIAFWVLPLSESNICPDPQDYNRGRKFGSYTSPIYQSSLIPADAQATKLVFSLDTNTKVGSPETQLLRYHFAVTTVKSQGGNSGVSQHPTLDVVSAVAVGLVGPQVISDLPAVSPLKLTAWANLALAFGRKDA